MKNLYLLLFFFSVSFLTNAQQFSPTNGPTSGQEDSKFVFVDDDVMFTGYGYNLLRSDDGGETWNIVTANFADIEILPTSMIRKGEYLFLSSFLGDRCYRSNDNGNTWETINTGLPTNYGYPAASPNRLEVSGDNIIMSSMNFTAISTDMGSSWQPIEAIEESITDGVNQLESGLYISSRGNQIPFPEHFIYKSLDNGITWEQLASVPSIPLLGIAGAQGTSAFDELNGYLYSSSTLNGNGLMRSNDNGETWENVGETYNFNTGKCVRNYDGVLYFTDLTGAYRSTDEGESWETIFDASLFELSECGYITRHNGKVWITTGKGPISYNESTGQLSNPAIPNASLTNMKASNGVILGLQNGKLYSSLDYGNNWTDITTNIGDGSDVLNFSIDGGEWIAHSYLSGMITLFKSTDNGQTWTAIQTVPGGGGGSAFFSYNPQFYAKGMGADIAIYKSNDDGATWNETSLTFLGDPLNWNAEVQGFEKHGDLIFADIKYGFAFSADAGETWTARKLASDGKVVGWPDNFLRLQDNGSGYQIQQSSDNGDTWTLTTDGFPILAGVIQYASGIGMVNGRVYVHNVIESAYISDYPGYYYYIENGSNTWAPAINLGQIPYSSISIDGTSESDLYISTLDHGVWTNATTTSVKSAEKLNQFISVYPNPANSNITFTCTVAEGQLTIVDITGRVVLQNAYRNGNYTADISILKSGLYVVIIEESGKRYQSKFIVE